MNNQLAQRLVYMLWENCPKDTGQLKASIQAMQINANEFQVLIGNGSGAINGTPSDVYASITNFAQTLGKNDKPNRNYHWINKTIKKWAEQNMLQFQLEGDEDE